MEQLQLDEMGALLAAAGLILLGALLLFWLRDRRP
jgi:LPXTG-motif cell wall-anchored protein